MTQPGVTGTFYSPESFDQKPILERKTCPQIQNLIDHYQAQIDLYDARAYEIGKVGDLRPRKLGGTEVRPKQILVTQVAKLEKAIEKKKKAYEKQSKKTPALSWGSR